MVPISIETNLYFSRFPYFRVFEKYFSRGKPVKKTVTLLVLNTDVANTSSPPQDPPTRYDR